MGAFFQTFNLSSINLFLELVPTWSTLRRLSSHRAIQSANIWALIVPIAAGVMERAQRELTIELFGQHFLLSLSLPFSWKMLFVAAIGFLLANIIFALFCPALIKETASYREFIEQKRSGGELFSLLQVKGMPTELRERWFNWFSIRQQLIHANQDAGQAFKTDNEERTFPEAYAEVVAALNMTRTTMRVLTGLLYLIGFNAFAILLYQNCIFVFKHW